MNKEEILNTFLLANIPEIITQEEFNDVKKAIKQLLQENKKLKEKLALHNGALKREHEAIHRVNDLEERIDKAIEWVKDWMHGANDWFEEDSKPSELLDILKEVEDANTTN